MIRLSIFGIFGILGYLGAIFSLKQLQDTQDTADSKNRWPQHHRRVFVVMVGYMVCGVVSGTWVATVMEIAT